MPLPEVGALCRQGRLGPARKGWLLQSAAWGSLNAWEAQFLCCFQSENVCMSMAAGAEGPA